MTTKKIIIIAIVAFGVFFCGQRTAAPKVCYLFSHGIVDNHTQAYPYVEAAQGSKFPIIKDPYITFDFADAKKGILPIKRTECSLAGSNEIHRLAHMCAKAAQAYEKIVLLGVSRGASVILTFLALCPCPNVAAAVLESPFDCIEHVMNSLINRAGLNWIPGLVKYSSYVARFLFCKYDPAGVKPIDCLFAINKDLPILIVCTLEDALVPAWSSMNVYRGLKESGHNAVHLLILTAGSHAKVIAHDVHGPIYQKVVNAFYRAYDLPYDAKLAQEGEELFEQTQPSSESLQQYYPKRMGLRGNV